MKKTQSTFRVLFLLILQFGLYTTVNGQIPPDTNLFQWKFSNNVSSRVALHLTNADLRYCLCTLSLVLEHRAAVL